MKGTAVLTGDLVARSFHLASPKEATIVARLVFTLTEEICVRTHTQHFNISLDETVSRCCDLMSAGHYAAILGFIDDNPIAVATFTESYALYAGGKVGTIQEFYVAPEHRSAGIGTLLVEAVRRHGQDHGWSAMELCTPPLPEFDRTLDFYRANGMKPVGGRKMRQNIARLGECGRSDI